MWTKVEERRESREVIRQVSCVEEEEDMRALRLGQRRMLRGMGGNWGSDRDEDEVGRMMGWR